MLICIACQSENKEDANVCKKCGVDMKMGPLWHPTWSWHLKTLGIVYVVLAIAYFSLSHFLGEVIPEPYKMRNVSKDVTPWLKP